MLRLGNTLFRLDVQIRTQTRNKYQLGRIYDLLYVTRRSTVLKLRDIIIPSLPGISIL